MDLLTLCAQAALSLLFASIGAAFLFSKKDLTAAFLTGAGEGIAGAVRLLPTLILLLVGTSMLTASGAAEAIASLLSPLLTGLGIPEEVICFLVTRPFSGAAGTAMASELLTKLGADSLSGIMVSLIMATSDTAVYVISVYLSAAGVKKSRHLIPSVILGILFQTFFCALLARRTA